MARAPAKPKAPKAPKAPPPVVGWNAGHVRAEHYHEIPNGDGVMRAELGDYIVTEGGVITVYPPARYAEHFGAGE